MYIKVKLKKKPNLFGKAKQNKKQCRQKVCDAATNSKVIFSCIIPIFGWAESYDIDLEHVRSISMWYR